MCNKKIAKRCTQELQGLALSTAEVAGELQTVLEMTGDLLARCERWYGPLHLKRCSLLQAQLTAHEELGTVSDGPARVLDDLRTRLGLGLASLGCSPADGYGSPGSEVAPACHLDTMD